MSAARPFTALSRRIRGWGEVLTCGCDRPSFLDGCCAECGTPDVEHRTNRFPHVA